MIVKIENLVKRYGDLIALDHLNLSIKEKYRTQNEIGRASF